jgi:hypothetical protein
MRAARRATVYLDPDLHRALRVKAAETDQSISDLVNAAVRLNLAEDAEDSSHTGSCCRSLNQTVSVRPSRS